METKVSKLAACLVVLFAIFSACSSSKSTTNSHTTKVENTGVYQTLADYLRRSPSVKIIGTGDDIQVMLRGVDSFGGNVEPLYVVDDAQLETYAQASRTVDVHDIRSVQVLNMMEATSSYGLRGSRGAIVIKTKKN